MAGLGNFVQIAVVVVVFLGMMLSVTLLGGALRKRRDAQREHLRRRLGAGAVDPQLFRAGTGVPSPWLGQVGAWLSREIEQAGSSTTPNRLIFQSAALALVGAVAGGWVAGSTGAALGIALGAVPLLLLRYAAGERSELITEQLPDGLDLIVRGLRAGHAFSDSLRTGAKELPLPLGEELGRVSEQHRLGRDLRECMAELIRRNESNFDMRLFVSSVLLQREAGGNLVEILDNLATTIRERLLFQGKVDALTAEVRFSAAVLAALPFVVGGALLILRPGYLSPLWQSELGRLLLVIGLGSLVMGAIVMRILAQVEDA